MKTCSFVLSTQLSFLLIMSLMSKCELYVFVICVLNMLSVIGSAVVDCADLYFGAN
jgi:hypothetical protein